MNIWQTDSDKAVSTMIEYTDAKENDMRFQVRESTWKWDDESATRDLGGGDGWIVQDHFKVGCFDLPFIDGHPDGPWSEYNPKFQSMSFNSTTGEMIIQGKSMSGRSYEYRVFFMKG